MAGARPHRRQVVLFLAAVILPSVLLAVLWVRLISQDRELQRSRLADDRRAVIAGVRAVAVTELESVEDEALAGLDDALGEASREYSHPDIRLVARVVNGRVVLPWEEDRKLLEAQRVVAEPAFAGRIRRGERAELGLGDPAGAARIYRDAGRRATAESQRVLALLLEARSRTVAGGRETAEPIYLELLATPDSVVDEYGFPFALYAASRLLEWGAAKGTVRQRLESASETLHWRSPTALYLLRDLWVSAGGDSADLDEERLRLESALAVQREYSLLANSRSLPNGNRTTDPAWLGMGPGDWIVKAIGAPGAEPAAVVAVSGESLARRLEAHEILRDAEVGSLEIAVQGGSGGTALGVARPDLVATFTDLPDAAVGSVLNLRNAFFFAALLLVLSITIFGGYLLLNDVRRETRTAELRSEFVSSVSHELKTPLTAIRMFAETLRKKKAPAPAVTAEYLDTIVGESERLTRLLNNVLDLSKIEQGLKSYQREPTSLAEVSRRAARALEYPLASAGFRLNLDLDEDLSPVTADGDSVEQAVLNLLTNAMKYSDASREIDLRLHRENGYAVIAVRDYGIGVPAEARPRLTEKFFRVRSPENEGVPGTGLGLTIVEHTARAHGGFVTVESKVGEGSTFAIHLPLEDRP